MWQRWRTQVWIGLAAAVPVVFSLAWWFFFLHDEDAPPSAPHHGPKLAVVLVFDQLRGDYLSKWQPLFCEGGFKRLQREGAWFDNCHYPYAGTLTAPGHASLLTGCTPNDHGIIANRWYDRKMGKEVESIDNNRGPGPLHRRQPTVGDVLLDLFRRRCRIVALSIKERSAILLAAARAQAVYWFNTKLGNFETSSHYPDGPHRWVTEFNNGGKTSKQWLKQPWNRLDPKLDYVKHSGPDDVAFEGSGHDQGQTFPHDTPNLKAVETSPFGNDLLFALAKKAIVAEKLGQRDVPDLLCVSFSSNDLVGHCFGPDSQEVLDVTLRSDLLIRDLLDFLDDKVGKGNYVVALSADHGICPIPAVAKLAGIDAGYVPRTLLTSRVEAFLQETFATAGRKEKWIDNASNLSVYLNQATLKALDLEPARVEKALAEFLAKEPGVQAAFTRTQLNVKEPLADALGEMARQSFDAERSGDVVVVLKPHHLMMETPTPRKTKEYATTHGSPHSYDTHVPLLVMGPGIRPGTYSERIAPQAMAVMVSRSLGIAPPAGARFHPPKEVYLSRQK